ncbi:MAG: DUF1501 domain-containing protein [Pirellulaceae bacterium]
MNTTRRTFLQSTLGASAVMALSGGAPRFLLEAAARDTEQGETEPGDDTVLVVVQLTGGNDGLNTVVPIEDDAYYRARPRLAVAKSDAIKIDDQFGLHPALTGMAELFKSGELAIVQGVGYPRPNRSHFESMDIWHSCRRKSQARPDGWLGRYLDAAAMADGRDVPALHLGDKKLPLALVGQDVRVPSVRSIDRFRLTAAPDVRKVVDGLATAERPTDDDLLGFVQSSTTAALEASRRVEAAKRGYRTEVDYPDSGLAGQLRTVAQLLDAGLSTRVYYVELDGFDTHAQQADVHRALLAELSQAVHAFLRDVAAHGHGDRVLLMAFSEFGRRVSENASQGTDHGAAAPMMLAGRRVRGGLHGGQPSLTDLEDGDLKHHTDFRQVYAAILEKWLAWSSKSVLGEEFKPLDLMRTT